MMCTCLTYDSICLTIAMMVFLFYAYHSSYFYEEGEMIMLSIKHLTKIYSGNKKAVDDISLDIQSGEFIAFIGTSGSGKTTALRMINRMIEATEGQIEIDGKDVRSMNPVELRRNIGYVIQQIGLMPHMTIKENIVLVPKLLKWTKEEKDKRAKELIKLVDLPESFLERYPAELSGGQQQRIGVVRALAAEQDIILMDEPLVHWILLREIRYKI